MNISVKIVPLLLILMLVLLPGPANTGAAAAELPLHYDLSNAVRLSRILDRHLMFTFDSSGCSYCTKFKEDVVSNPHVREIINDHYVFSLVSFDKTFTITLPEEGEMSNMELASALGVTGTPATYFFYPPDPGLSGRGIVGIPGVLGCEYVSYYSESADELLALSEYCGDQEAKEKYEEGIGITVWALARIGALTPEGDGDGDQYLNYLNPKKEISPDEFQFLQEQSFPIPVVGGLEEVQQLESPREVILDLPGDGSTGEEVADSILAETDVKKVFIVTESEEAG
ncbi:MAG: thioredoxin family protein [Candidatus Bipolaricaulota bacterium]